MILKIFLNCLKIFKIKIKIKIKCVVSPALTHYLKIITIYINMFKILKKIFKIKIL
jgi:hypothetical protein